MRALESFCSPMDFYMFIQVCLLSEGESAVWIWAQVGSFICVDSQMIKEIVPFPEVFAAVFLITLENLDEAFTLGILESEDSEFLCCWYMFLYLYGSQIEGAA